MIAAGRGRILQVASIAAFQPAPLYAVYAASKAYVLNMSAAMHYESAEKGVTVTTLCPGLTDSEFHQRADHLKPKYMDAMMMSSAQVANSGVNAMMKGRVVITPGLINKLMGLSVKLLPRSWATAIAALSMQSSR